MSIISVTPNTGSSTGGIAIKINGSGFSAITHVTFNDNDVTIISYSSTMIIITLPAVTMTTVTLLTQIKIIGSTTITNNTLFTYYNIPIITTVSPNIGTSNGGISITITGNGFIDVTNVTFNTVNATNIFYNINTITLTLPAVTITTPVTVPAIIEITVGTGTNIYTGSNSTLFIYYDAPIITDIYPNTGLLTGNESIIINGKYLKNINEIKIGPYIVPTYTIPVSSTSAIHLYTPVVTSNSGLGSQQVAIKCNAIPNPVPPGNIVNELTIYSIFTYLTPIISSIYPNQGPTAGNTAITLTGINFIETISATMNGNPLTVTLVNNTITAFTPAFSGPNPATIIVTFNGYVTASILYLYSNVPIITLVTPNGGPESGGTIILIQGASFDSSTQVSIGGKPANILSISNTNTLITVITPSGSGPEILIVTTTDGSASTTFTYLPRLPSIEEEGQCTAPPYNATNFTSANKAVYNTLVNYAKNSPNYPWNTGIEAQQIYRSQQNISYFNTLNQKTSEIRTLNNTVNGNIPYPPFKSQAERLMYIQGLSLTASRNNMTGQNPSAPMGVPCSTIYQIINS